MYLFSKSIIYARKIFSLEESDDYEKKYNYFTHSLID